MSFLHKSSHEISFSKTFYTKISYLPYKGTIFDTRHGQFLYGVRNVQSTTTVPSLPRTNFSTEYGLFFLSTEYGEYEVQRVRYSRRTNFSTEHGHNFQHGVRSTKSTVLQGYEFKHEVRSLFLARGTESTKYGEYGTRGVRI